MKRKPVALISGGCGGLGRVIGAKLAEDGFDIIALYKTMPRESADAVVEGFAFGEHRAILCDIQDENDVAKVIAETMKSHDGIDACIHAAVDPILRKDILEIDAAELTSQLGAGLFGGFQLLTQAARVMGSNERRGTLIAILSPIAEPGALYPHMSGYAIGKYALRGLLKELYRELLSSSITVNAVSPNFIDTKLNHDLPAAVRNFMLEHPARGGINTPQEVANAVSLLASEDGRAINGKIFSFEIEKDNPL